MNKNIKNEDIIAEVECEVVEDVVEETKMDKVKKTVKKWVKPVGIGLAAAGAIAGGIYLFVREHKGNIIEDAEDYEVYYPEESCEEDCETDE